MNLSQIYIYRITHITNIPHILKHGITHKNSPNANADYVSIGDTSLIEKREKEQIMIKNGNYSECYGSIVASDFIPFYFGVRMPMLYVIQRGGNYVKKATPPNDIVYLVCKLNNIIQSHRTYYFSDGHAMNRLTMFYDSSKITELPSIIDWASIKSRDWGGEKNLEKKQKKQAEFLVSNDIAPENICGFICYDENSKQHLIDIGVDRNIIEVDTQAYY